MAKPRLFAVAGTEGMSASGAGAVGTAPAAAVGAKAGAVTVLVGATVAGGAMRLAASGALPETIGSGRALWVVAGGPDAAPGGFAATTAAELSAAKVGTTASAAAAVASLPGWPGAMLANIAAAKSGSPPADRKASTCWVDA